MCHAIRSDTIEQTTVYRWFDRFRNEDQSLQDKPKSESPTTIDLKQLKQAIKSDPTLSTINLANKVGCIQRNIQYQIKRLGLIKNGKFR